MKIFRFNQTIGTALAVGASIVIIGSVAQAQLPRNFDRIRGFARHSIPARTTRVAQQNQAPGPSTSQGPTLVRYMVMDLGADNAIGNDISDSGRVVGSKDFGGGQRHAVFWPNLQSPAVDLGILPGATRSLGFAINPLGQMVGTGHARPMFWANSQSAPNELPGLSEEGLGIASDINAAGQIVGQFEDDTGARPVFWASSNTSAIYLPPISEHFPNGAAFSINASGNILGDACDADFVECHAAFWSNGASVPVPLASPNDEFIYTDLDLTGGSTSERDALNNSGSMVGFAIKSDFSETRAVYWASSSSPAVILSTTDDFPNGQGEGINDSGQIVGDAYNSDYTALHGFFWPSPNSPGIDLDTVIPAEWTIVIARSINNRGEISGAAFLAGDESQHAVVLIPVQRR